MCALEGLPKEAQKKLDAALACMSDAETGRHWESNASEAPAFPLVLEVSNLAGPLCTVEAVNTWSVYRLKQAIAEATGIHPANQKLFHDGENLSHSSVLHDLFPAVGAEVVLVRVQDFFVRLQAPFEGSGENLILETLTLKEAKDRCSSLEDCQGFHFSGEVPEDSDVPLQVAFKKKSGFELVHAGEGYFGPKPSTTYLLIHDAESRAMLIDFVSKEHNRKAVRFIQQSELVEDLVRSNFFAFPYICSGLRNDPEIVRVAIMQNPQVLDYASDAMKNNKDLILEAVRRNGLALQYASSEMRSAQDVLLAAMEENADSFRFACKHLKQDKAIALRFVGRRGMGLKDLSDKLRSDRDIVLAAVRQNGNALKWASCELRSDEELQSEAKSQILSSKFR